MADVFVSYASEDRDRVRSLVEVLESHGWSVWWDRTMYAGPRFDDVIEEALDAARSVVVVWSKHSIRSDWVRNEATEGLKRGILVPVAFDVVTVPLAFRHNQTAQLTEWPRLPGEVEQVVGGVRAIVGGEERVQRRNGVTPIAARIEMPRRRLAYAIAGVLLITVVAATFLWQRTPQPPSERATRTAVFTFTTPPGDARAGDLARAIANEVVDTFDLTGMQVIGRRELQGLSGVERTTRATALGAEFALDGDVRRDADEWVATVGIDQVASSTTLWTETYRARDTDAHSLARRIATQVADTLRCTSFQPSAPGWVADFGVPHDDADSLGLLLRACSSIRTGEGDAAAMFRTLVQRYPASAELNARLAMNLQADMPFAHPTARTSLEHEMDQALARAFSLDPASGTAHTVSFLIKDAARAPAGELESTLAEGLRMTPTHSLLNASFAGLLTRQGRFVEAEVYARRAVAADPLSIQKPIQLARILAANGKVPESQRARRDPLARWSDAGVWHHNMAMAVFLGGPDVEELLAMTPNVGVVTEGTDCWRALVAALGTKDAIQRQASGLDATQRCRANEALSEEEIVAALAALGDFDQAFRAAERLAGWRNRDFAKWPLFLAPPGFANDPRFMPLMQRLGYLDAWTSTGHWPDFCDHPDLAYDCKTEAARLMNADAAAS